jgi:tetratricopeptide (TPR) repeat protein
LSKLTRRELKEDRLQTAFEDYEAFAKEHAREIVTSVVLLLVAIGAVFGVKSLLGRTQASANAKLATALDTYHAYVGSQTASLASQGEQTFATDQEKYQKALAEFQSVSQVTGFEKLLPRIKAMRIAECYAGMCQAHLGQDAAAVKTLQKSAQDSDPAIASLAKLELAGEYAKSGKTSEAIKIYQELSDHPSATVPRSTSLLALASLYRATQPVQAKQIYERLVSEYGTDPTLAAELKQQISSLGQ